MERHFVVVAYDISDDRRRTKLYNALLGHGTPVQFSVFECLVTAGELAQMQRKVRRIIKPRLDHVRYYHLCRACVARIETTQAGAAPAAETDQWIV